MTRFSFSLPIALLVIVAALTLGSDRAGATASLAPDNPFAGSWSGTFTTSAGGFGPIELEISESGVVRGNLVNVPNGISGYLLGAVNKHGFGSAHLKNPPNVNIPYLMDVHIDGSGNLVGTYQALGNFGFTGEFVLSPQ